ncbi:MAG: citrate synthase [Nannocystaceae bacterium]|nr:citrate synthase [Nannocystaceae bacterium]
MEPTDVHAEGLDRVVVARTAISMVDGEAGRLVLAGRAVEDLAGVRFEAIVSRLWRAAAGPRPDPHAIVPAGLDETSLRTALGAARRRAATRLGDGGAWLQLPVAMDAVRGAVALLHDDTPALDVVATVAVATAWWIAARRGVALPPPDGARDHASDLLRMITGEAAPAPAAALARYLVTVSDHGMNASTFAARVVTSTGADPVSAVVAALGALKGPLHGGAPGPVLDMLDAVGEPARAHAWLQAQLDAGHRIMGMGHRIYRVRDPRAAALEQAITSLEPGAGASRGGAARLALARAVEREATALLAARHPERPLAANVEFYTAVLLDALELPREAFTAIFACGRVAGWLAHVEEQRRCGRLVRPQSQYVGD